MVSLDRECTGKSALCCWPGFSRISLALYAPLFRKSETAGKKRHGGQEISGRLQWILRFQRNDRLQAIHSPFRFRRPQLTSEDVLLGKLLRDILVNELNRFPAVQVSDSDADRLVRLL
jgi:hypothetical protein